MLDLVSTQMVTSDKSHWSFKSAETVTEQEFRDNISKYLASDPNPRYRAPETVPNTSGNGTSNGNGSKL